MRVRRRRGIEEKRKAIVMMTGVWRKRERGGQRKGELRCFFSFSMSLAHHFDVCFEGCICLSLQKPVSKILTAHTHTHINAKGETPPPEISKVTVLFSGGFYDCSITSAPNEYLDC